MQENWALVLDLATDTPAHIASASGSNRAAEDARAQAEQVRRHAVNVIDDVNRNGLAPPWEAIPHLVAATTDPNWYVPGISCVHACGQWTHEPRGETLVPCVQVQLRMKRWGLIALDGEQSWPACMTACSAVHRPASRDSWGRGVCRDVAARALTVLGRLNEKQPDMLQRLVGTGLDVAAAFHMRLRQGAENLHWNITGEPDILTRHTLGCTGFGNRLWRPCTVKLHSTHAHPLSVLACCAPAAATGSILIANRASALSPHAHESFVYTVAALACKYAVLCRRSKGC